MNRGRGNKRHKHVYLVEVGVMSVEMRLRQLGAGGLDR
jgi:hypothetical protein